VIKYERSNHLQSKKTREDGNEMNLGRLHKFRKALYIKLKRKPTNREFGEMLDEYIDFLEDFHDECEVPDIQDAFLYDITIP